MRLSQKLLGKGARVVLTCVTIALLAGGQVIGASLQQLRSELGLNPKRLMSRVSRFKYELHADVQSPEVFLKTETGDCDDFATMAAMVLKEKGFTPRLIAVRMPGLTHVVCYVAEEGAYLDYNNRVYFRALVKCKPGLPEIANEVAKSFESSWTTASEFLYTNEVKVMVTTIARAETFTQPAPVATASMSAPAVRQLDISF